MATKMHPQGGVTADEQRRVDAFLQLTRLERGLRSMLETELAREDGPRWVRALPNDVKQKVEGKGLAYSDFPDLKKVLGSSWRKLRVADRASISKQTATVHLEGLETIRNDLAHSRDISEGSLAQVQAAHHVLSRLFEADDTNAETALPPTEHPEVALARVKAAIDGRGLVAKEDLEALDLTGTARTKIEEYLRVRSRPGRDPLLMSRVQAAALASLNQLIPNGG